MGCGVLSAGPGTHCTASRSSDHLQSLGNVGTYRESHSHINHDRKGLSRTLFLGFIRLFSYGVRTVRTVACVTLQLTGPLTLPARAAPPSPSPGLASDLASLGSGSPAPWSTKASSCTWAPPAGTSIWISYTPLSWNFRRPLSSSSPLTASAACTRWPCRIWRRGWPA